MMYVLWINPWEQDDRFSEEFHEEINITVLDAVTAPFEYAEMLADLSKFGWTHSKIGGYESPPVTEIMNWDTEENYENPDVWTEGDDA